MAIVGDKYIIEIAEVFPGAESGQPKYRIKGFDNLVFDDKGLRKLNNLVDIYNKAYHEGYVEGYQMGAVNNDNVQIPANAGDGFMEGFQTASIKFVKIIHDMIDAYEKLTDIEEDN